MASPIRLAAHASTNLLGGFIMEVLGFATFSRAFPAMNTLRLTYNDGGAFKGAVIDLCAQIEMAYPIGEELLPLQALSRKGRKQLRDRPGALGPLADKALGDGLQDTWLTLSSNMRGSCYNLLEPAAKFRIPPQHLEALERQLIEAGADPKRFIVAMHCREGSAPNIRNVDPLVYYEVARHIIEAQGGQVVKLGQPSPIQWPATPGLVDLTRIDSLMLQAYAISRARYAYCAHSGLLHLAMALQTPLAAADAVNHSALATYDETLCLTKTYIGPDGAQYRGSSALEAGLLDLEPDTLPEGFSIRDSTAAELCRLADRLNEMTGDVGGWREPEPQSPWEPDARIFKRLTLSTRKWKLRPHFA